MRWRRYVVVQLVAKRIGRVNAVPAALSGALSKYDCSVTRRKGFTVTAPATFLKIKNQITN
jgi:hypothetical protein